MFAERILAPTGGPAACVGEVRVLIRQTGGTDVRVLGEVDGMIQLENGQIVVQRTGIVFGMNVHRYYIAFDVGEELHVMVDIPFAQTHTQIEAILTAAEGINWLVKTCTVEAEAVGTYDLMQWAAEMMCWASIRVPPQA